jgi:hypothetical protein
MPTSSLGAPYPRDAILPSSLSHQPGNRSGEGSQSVLEQLVKDAMRRSRDLPPPGRPRAEDHNN